MAMKEDCYQSGWMEHMNGRFAFGEAELDCCTDEVIDKQ